MSENVNGPPVQSKALLQRINEAKDIAYWVHDRTNSLQFSADDKTRCFCACFQVALEHHDSIIILFEKSMYGSGLALARPLFESYIRGIWLRERASDDDVEKYKKDKLPWKMSARIKEIEELDAYSGGTLSASLKENYGKMCSFTHTGFEQAVRRMSDGYIEPNYSDEDLCQAIRFVSAHCLLVGLELQLSKAKQVESVCREFSQKITDWVTSETESDEENTAVPSSDSH